MAEPLTPQEVAALLQHIEDLKAENARLRSQQPLLGVLRELAIDPAVPPHIRLKAAEAGVQYEQPKLSATLTHFSGSGIGARFDAKAARKRELDHLKVIEGGRSPDAA